MRLKGKTPEQIMSAIRGLKQEIGRLKNIVEHPNYELRSMVIHPTEKVQISMNQEYLERAKQALDAIKGLKGCDVHATVVLSDTDKETLRKLGTNATYEPYKKNDNLYYN